MSEINARVEAPAAAAKECRGRFYEDFDVGDVYRGRLGPTVTDKDNTTHRRRAGGHG